MEELHAEPDDVVLEIGPGHGELSQHLLGRVRRLVLIEKDHDLASGLRDHWGEREDVQIVDADALKVDLAELCGGGVPFRIISNVPYNITSPLVFAFLAFRPSPTRILLTVQREVAVRRLGARRTLRLRHFGFLARYEADHGAYVGPIGAEERQQQGCVGLVGRTHIGLFEVPAQIAAPRDREPH